MGDLVTWRATSPIRCPQSGSGQGKEWPDELPLSVQISATDWIPGGWDIDQSVLLAQQLKEIGVDLIDCSSGFAVPNEPVPFGPGFQVPFAARIRAEVGFASGAVGFITEPAKAEQIVATGQADVVLLARRMLLDPSQINSSKFR